jgi:hypothetical protein
VFTLSKRHFNTFRREVLQALRDYNITGFTTTVNPGGNKSPGSMAWVNIQLEGRRADVYLSDKWTEEPTLARLTHTARHEVLHILLARLSGLASQRHVSTSELYEAEEELVANLLVITSGLHRKPRTAPKRRQ